MTRVPLTASSLLGWLAWLGTTSFPLAASSQEEPPEPPPLPTPIGPASSSEDDASATDDPYAEGAVEAEGAGAPEGEEPTAGDADASEEDPWSASNPDEAGGAPPPSTVPAAGEPPADYAAWYRQRSIHEQNTLSGSTGLHRVRYAGSAAPGTFRFGLTGGLFLQSGFLCTPNAPCTDPVTGFVEGADDAQKIEAIASLSVTPFSFLEAFINFRNSATSNSNGAPRLLQVVGDTSLGVKAFYPAAADRLFTFGGEMELGLLTGTGGVGLDGGATSFAMRALGTLDLHNRSREEDRFPLRAHLNLGYFFDNSASVVSAIENTAPPVGRGAPIQRTERYGLNVSRVDAFEIGLGVEYVNEWVRPFLEWTADLPVNRQGYVCNVEDAASRGDLCLGVAAGLNTSPNRFTFGARGFPWQESGLAVTFAVDVGTGGTVYFLEETTPEAPYTLWLGVSYAVDTVPPEPRVVREAAAPAAAERAPRRFIVGRIENAAGNAAIPDALVRYEGRNWTGMIADKDGRFRSSELEPGTYEFRLYAEQFKDGTCTVTIPEELPPRETDSADAEATADVPADPYGEEEPVAPVASTTPSAEGPTWNEDGDIEIPVTCVMKELPRVANVVGLLVDASTGGAIADASVTITDKLNRSLTVAADAQGSLVFQNVPFGESYLTVSAPGYLNTVMVVNVDSRKELEVHVVMNKRPAKLGVEIGPREIRLLRPLAFVGETAEISSDTMIAVEELAQALRDHPKIGALEIQVHSDDSGAPSYSRRLTQERADVLKATLVRLGVEEERLVAKGYGPDQPLVPNVSDANRQKNKRVQLIIQK